MKKAKDSTGGKHMGLTHTIKTADEIIKALEENSKVEFFIGRKY